MEMVRKKRLLKSQALSKFHIGAKMNIYQTYAYEYYIYIYIYIYAHIFLSMFVNQSIILSIYTSTIYLYTSMRMNLYRRLKIKSSLDFAIILSFWR